jgi:hypothetical protein
MLGFFSIRSATSLASADFTNREQERMRLLEWLKRRGAPSEDRHLREWRRAWAEVVAAPDSERIRRLRADLDALGHAPDDIEIEREMLDALHDAAELATAIRQTGLPLVATGHRVVGVETCHYTAPASMPDEPGQPGGRLLLTGGRAIFVGGANRIATPWHSIGDASHVERDVVLIRADREQLYRFRCNSYSDALRGAFIARELVAARRRPRPGL